MFRFASSLCLFSALVLAVISVPASPVRADLIDFNSPGQLAADFQENYNTPDTRPSQYSESTTAGVGGSGGLSLINHTWNGHDGDVLINKGSVQDMTSGPLTVSAMVYYLNSDYPYNFPIQVGLVGNTTSQLTGAAPFVSVFLRTWSPTGDFTYGGGYNNVYLKYDQTGLGNIGVGDSVHFSITPDHWYKLTATFAAGGGYFTVDGALEDWGTAGTAFSSIVRTLPSYTFASTNTLTSDTSVYGAYYGSGADGGAMDNFSITPEPATLSLLGLGGLALLRRRTRKA